MWNSIVSFFRKMPVAKWIRPLWKAGLLEANQRGGDMLQKELNALLVNGAEHGLAEAQKRVDGLQAWFERLIDGLPLPAELEARIKSTVRGPVDELQAKLAEGCASGCTKKAQVIFDAAFDRFQQQLAERISAL